MYTIYLHIVGVVSAVIFNTFFIESYKWRSQIENENLRVWSHLLPRAQCWPHPTIYNSHTKQFTMASFVGLPTIEGIGNSVFCVESTIKFKLLF